MNIECFWWHLVVLLGSRFWVNVWYPIGWGELVIVSFSGLVSSRVQGCEGCFSNDGFSVSQGLGLVSSPECLVCLMCSDMLI